MFKRLKVAAINFVPWKWHKEWNSDKLEMCIKEAAKRGAKLAVAPEEILDGCMVNEVVHFPELREPMVQIAEPIDGPSVKRFQRLARQLGIAIVFGMAERRGRRDVYNTALFLDASGRLCGVYSKMQFAEGYDKTWYFNRIGKKIRAFDTPFGRCGLLICNDRWNPMLARTLALDGARFLCIASQGDTRKPQDEVVLAQARENGIPVVHGNVGKNLIISKGEIVAVDARSDAVTIAEIDIPAPCGSDAARLQERKFLAERPAMMEQRLKRTLRNSKKYRENARHGGRPPKPRKKTMIVCDHTKGKWWEVAPNNRDERTR
jgi:predicted amidohydrolase